MSDLRTAAQQALEFLDAEFGWSPGEAPRIDALKAALAQQAEPVEPVAWFYQNMYTEQEYLVWKKGTGGRNWRPLYTAPPQRKPLTDEEIAAEWRKASEFAGKSEGAVTTSQFVQIFARAVERAHGIGEGA